jgi:pimeloyl-ACP methyl ester carboxylesterase
MPATHVVLFAAVLLGQEPAVDTKFVQVAPAVKPGAAIPIRTPGQPRAVVLLHGLRIHPISDTNALHAELSGWEEPGSPLVKALGKDADVFAFGYAQHLSVDAVARAPALRQDVSALRQVGYTEVVLVGYSAGALIAREFVEDEPACGVTKVIQVCAPNGGSNWGKFTAGVRQSQEPFLLSLTKEARQSALRDRADRRIPPAVEFVCVVGTFGRVGDGFVRSDCQWTRDLQDQGVPAVVLHTPHVGAMKSKAVAATLAELIREPQPRWSAMQVEGARLRLFGRDKESDRRDQPLKSSQR